jgi:hypothetical protein
MLEAMARIAPSQPNEAMARIASRRNCTISLDQYCRIKIPREKFFKRRILYCSRRFKLIQKDDRAKSGSSRPVTTEIHNFTFSVGAVSAGPPL